MTIDKHDQKEIRCPRLGGDVIFKFCRTCDPPFCHRIIVCWAQNLDIGTFLASNYTPMEIRQGLEKKAGDKLGQILTLADKARSS